MPEAAIARPRNDAPADAPEIRVSRRLAAPRGLVWAAWTDPERVSAWWGPVGFATTTHAWDLRPGGVWRFTMHGPDGTDYPNRLTFTAVEAPSRLEYEIRGEGASTEGVAVENRVEFAETESGTMVTLAMRFASVAERDRVIARYGALEGAHQTLERLAEMVEAALAAEAPADEPVIRLTRELKAPRPLVWEAWTDPARVSLWWGPHGFTTTTHAHDLRPGGTWAFTMHGPDGTDYGNRVVFETVEPPARLTYAHYAAGDPDDKPHFNARVVFDEAVGATRVTLTLVCASVAFRDGLVRFGAVEGGRQTLARFAALLGES